MKKAARQTVNDALPNVHVANVLLYWYSACPGKKKPCSKHFQYLNLKLGNISFEMYILENML